MTVEFTEEYREMLKELCERATPGPWHYFPCGEKSNDCLLGVAMDENGESPPAGLVECSPYNEETCEYEMDKYVLEPMIASSEGHADYDDFCFMAHARTALPAALALIDRLEKELAEAMLP